MKNIIFLDIDGVLNTTKTLNDGWSLEDDLLSNLLVLKTVAKADIVLTSSWRMIPAVFQKFLRRINNDGYGIFGLTCQGVPFEWLKQTQWKDVKPCPKYDYDDEICFDRGAEIAEWLSNFPYVNDFIIIDDEIEDIKDYFPPEKIVKTDFRYGLTMEKVTEADLKLKRLKEK